MNYQNLIAQMTLEEKARLMSGKGFWDTADIPALQIPSMVLSDGPHGIRRQAGEADHLGQNESLKATCFPTAAAVANSWNPELAEEIGRLLGEEARSQGVDMILGPGLNIKRSPLCGRNFEYFSEDPYLAGKMAAGYVRGIQSQGVAACPKHFAANSQELRRMSVDSVMDERTLREIYTTGFEIAVKESRPRAIMTAYNPVNGEYANENRHLLQEILKDEWNFDGLVVSDWGGSNDHAAGVAAGSHLEMPTTGKDGVRLIVEAVENGTLKEEMLDQRVDEFLTVVLELKKTQTEIQIFGENTDFDTEAHHRAARKAAEECIVLLKNEDGILPLRKDRSIAIIGDFAEKPRYQGAGSSLVNVTSLEIPVECWKNSGADIVGYEPGFRRNGQPDEKMKQRAVDLAKKADTVVLYMGLDEIAESEGMDREHLRLADNQIQVLEAVAEENPDVVVILSAGSVVEMPWLSRVKGLLHGYLPGQAGAGAVVDVALGKVCPSGRLAETYPMKLADTPCARYYPGRERTAEYREGIYVGYRYYDTADVPVRFPFGFGLSYTTFSYEELEFFKDGIHVTVKNTGACAGAETVQMYVEAEDSRIFRPMKELKGFCKVWLQPGEKKTVEILFDDKTFRYYNAGTNQWEQESGTYRILVGSSTKQIYLRKEIEITGTDASNPYSREKLASYYTADVANVSDEEFETLLGRRLPESKWRIGGELTINDAVCQMYYAKSVLARLAIRVIAGFKDRSMKKGKPDLNLLFIYNIPFRGIAKMMGGAVSMEMVYGLLEMVNGHFLKGLGKLVKGAVNNGRK